MPDRSAHSDAPSSARARVVEAIAELHQLAGESLPSSAARHLDAGVERLSQARLHLVVLGEFKRGKSTLVNALLGVEVLPTGVVPLTSAITIMRHGERERLIVRYEDGREEEHPVGDLHRFVTERENPHNARAVASTIVEAPSSLLASGLQLVDTPGIGSVHAHNTDVAWEFMPRVDAALCVLSAEQPFTQAEREFFQAVGERVPRLLIVVNKIDHLAADEHHVAIEFIREVSATLFAASELEFFATSARSGEGIGALRERIARLAEHEADALLTRSVASLAARVAHSATQSLHFEAHAIELPLEELRSRGELFERRAGELRDARSQAADLLAVGVGRVLDQRVNEPLMAFARERADELRARLSAQIAELGPMPARELAPALDAWIDETIRARFDELVPHLEAAVAAEVRALQQRFAQRIEAILAEIQDAAAEAFGSRAGDQLPEVDLSEPAAFSFKLADVAHMLDTVVAVGRRSMPGQLGRKMVTRDAQERLLHMADRHAGRLRWALVERVRNAVAEYQRELSSTVDDAILAIQATVQRVSVQLSTGEEEVRTRRVDLETRAARLEFLADELAALASSASSSASRLPTTARSISSSAAAARCATSPSSSALSSPASRRSPGRP